MANHLTSFVCFNCRTEHPADYDGYLCRECGGNLNAVYDYQAVAESFTVDRLKQDDEQTVWRYSELFPFADRRNVPGLHMGITPLYRNRIIEQQIDTELIYLKDDTRLPSASFKDRASSVVMAVAIEKGVERVACASTGNAGCSWACMGATCGMPVTIFVPASAPEAKIAQLEVYGADVRRVDGSYDDAFALCVEECEKHGYFNRNTGFNPYTREGKKSVSFEIWEQFGYRAPASVFVPVGDGNIISGVWKGFYDLQQLGLIDEMPAIFAVQSTNSDAIAKTISTIEQGSQSLDDFTVATVSATTRADSIAVDTPSDGVSAVRAVMETGGKAVTVSDQEILAEIWELASSTGIFAEPAGVTAVAGLKKFALAGGVVPAPAVALVTGNGLKDVKAVLEA